MPNHFEDLWTKCEETHKALNLNETVSSIIEEAIMKLNLYKAIDARTEIPKEELSEIKLRALGEILLSLTNLSLKDDLNTFKALSIAQQYRQIELNKKIPLDLKLPGKH